MPAPKNKPVKLTKAYVDKVKPPSEGYEVHWDSLVKGYGLRLSPTGKRVFIATGRVKGRQITYTVGPYGELTEYEAREKARTVLQRMREGVDPRDERKQDEAAKVTLKTVAAAYCERPQLKQSSKDAIMRHVLTTLSPWQNKPIASITEDACRQRYRKLARTGLDGRREGGAPGQANQAFSVLRALINFSMRRYKRADGTPVIASNPVSGLKDDWVQLKPRTDRIPDDKVGEVWAKLNEWRSEAYNRDRLASIDLIMFLMMTGCRLNEAASLMWTQVNLEEGWFYLPDPKNRNSVTLPLSTQAVDLLKTRQRIEGSPFVFTTWSRAGYIRSPRDLMLKVSKVVGEHVTPHSLRRTFVTIGIANCGIDFYKVELLTNHIPHSSVTAVHYLETSNLRYLRPETQRISDWIAEQAAIVTGENVVTLRA